LTASAPLGLTISSPIVAGSIGMIYSVKKAEKLGQKQNVMFLTS
jgi:hypothetical protein